MPTADGGFVRNKQNNYNYHWASIKSVDAMGRKATGITRVGTSIDIDLRHSTGAVLVTPSLGEQWTAVQQNGIWMLQNKLMGHDPNLLTEASLGQHILGSSYGPIELNATAVNAHAPVVIQNVTTSGRPTGVAVGSHVFDTTISKPIWYDGTNWVDGTGTIV